MSELIDRQALLDECLNHYEVGNIEQNCTMDWICKTVRNFPAASPWHRVEEELPVKGEIVIVSDGKRTWDVGQYRCLAFSDGDRTKWWWKGHTIKTVKWWMRKKDALPEPPKEDA